LGKKILNLNCLKPAQILITGSNPSRIFNFMVQIFTGSW